MLSVRFRLKLPQSAARKNVKFTNALTCCQSISDLWQVVELEVFCINVELFKNREEKNSQGKTGDENGDREE